MKNTIYQAFFHLRERRARLLLDAWSKGVSNKSSARFFTALPVGGQTKVYASSAAQRDASPYLFAHGKLMNRIGRI